MADAQSKKIPLQARAWAGLKEANNRPLSTDDRNCQASEEERPENKRRLNARSRQRFDGSNARLHQTYSRSAMRPATVIVCGWFDLPAASITAECGSSS